MVQYIGMLAICHKWFNNYSIILNTDLPTSRTCCHQSTNQRMAVSVLCELIMHTQYVPIFGKVFAADINKLDMQIRQKQELHSRVWNVCTVCILYNTYICTVIWSQVAGVDTRSMVFSIRFPLTLSSVYVVVLTGLCCPSNNNKDWNCPWIRMSSRHPLVWPPLGPAKVSWLEEWPNFSGGFVRTMYVDWDISKWLEYMYNFGAPDIGLSPLFV